MLLLALEGALGPKPQTLNRVLTLALVALSTRWTSATGRV